MNLAEFKKRLSVRVRGLRASKGLRQDDLEAFGLSWKSIQKIEYGITDVKASTLLKLCKAFDTTLPELLRDMVD